MKQYKITVAGLNSYRVRSTLAYAALVAPGLTGQTVAIMNTPIDVARLDPETWENFHSAGVLCGKENSEIPTIEEFHKVASAAKISALMSDNHVEFLADAHLEGDDALFKLIITCNKEFYAVVRTGDSTSEETVAAFMRSLIGTFKELRK